MANSEVSYTLKSSIKSATFYVTSGDKECLSGHDTPYSFSDDQSGQGTATAKSSDGCAFKDSHIHIYIWSDEAYTDKLVNIKLYEKDGTNTWHPDLESVDPGYNLNTTSSAGKNKYTFTLESVS